MTNIINMTALYGIRCHFSTGFRKFYPDFNFNNFSVISLDPIITIGIG
jgi:hypothetical protein